LLDICSRKNPDIEQLRQAVIYLNPFYIESRYPVNWPVHYEKNTALKAKQMAEQIGNWVINSLGSEK
jgi:HEPN domain-containing protein